MRKNVIQWYLRKQESYLATVVYIKVYVFREYCFDMVIYKKQQ